MIKRTPLKRKTPLNRGKKALKSSGKLRKVGKQPISKLAKKLWELCRKIVKATYPHKCYTCGKTLIEGTADFHIGHFIPKSVCSTELKYSLDNLRPQCSACNIWKSGNWPAFEKHLIEDKGEQFVIDLKKRNIETKGLKYGYFWYEKEIEKLSTLGNSRLFKMGIR